MGGLSLCPSLQVSLSGLGLSKGHASRDRQGQAPTVYVSEDHPAGPGSTVLKGCPWWRRRMKATPLRMQAGIPLDRQHKSSSGKQVLGSGARHPPPSRSPAQGHEQAVLPVLMHLSILCSPGGTSIC